MAAPPFKNGSGLKITKSDLEGLRKRVEALTQKQVLVGVPSDTSDRTKGDTSITNAQLAYIHDNGAPEQNIPARPFMVPGIMAARETLVRIMASAARNAAKGGAPGQADQGLHRMGLAAQRSIRNAINQGIPPPLADSTLRERARRPGRKSEGAAWELAWRQAGAGAGVDIAKPLIDTGQLRNSITYVIRTRPTKFSV